MLYETVLGSWEGIALLSFYGGLLLIGFLMFICSLTKSDLLNFLKSFLKPKEVLKKLAWIFCAIAVIVAAPYILGLLLFIVYIFLEGVFALLGIF